MSLYESKMYMDDVRYVADLDLPWEKLKDRSVMLSGATGLIGSFLIDVLVMKNQEGLNCTIYALGRSVAKMKERFQDALPDEHLRLVPCDVNVPLDLDNIGKVDYVLHLASNTHPMQYSTDPIGTITTNVLGAINLLNFATEHSSMRFAFASSNEIYGENRGDTEFFDEKYCGYINCNTMRAGYPESKRCGETLCQAYKAKKGLDVVIMRLTRTYGPTMLMTDTKAINQFIKKGISGEDVVLKSAGTQFYSYQYVADSVAGVFTILLCGENGEAYNIAEENGDGTLKDIAEIVAGMNGRKVVYETPDQIEAAGYSTATKARLNGLKLQALGWKPKYDIKSGLKRTIEILRSID